MRPTTPSLHPRKVPKISGDSMPDRAEKAVEEVGCGRAKGSSVCSGQERRRGVAKATLRRRDAAWTTEPPFALRLQRQARRQCKSDQSEKNDTHHQSDQRISHSSRIHSSRRLRAGDTERNNPPGRTVQHANRPLGSHGCGARAAALPFAPGETDQVAGAGVFLDHLHTPTRTSLWSLHGVRSHRKTDPVGR